MMFTRAKAKISETSVAPRSEPVCRLRKMNLKSDLWDWLITISSASAVLYLNPSLSVWSLHGFAPCLLWFVLPGNALASL